MLVISRMIKNKEGNLLLYFAAFLTVSVLTILKDESDAVDKESDKNVQKHQSFRIFTIKHFNYIILLLSSI